MKFHSNRDRGAGFTLVEIMIVVVIIGLLASMAIAAFKRVREESRNTAFVNDLRVFGQAIQNYAMEHGGSYPPDVGQNVVPAELADWVRSAQFLAETPIGGVYDYEGPNVWNGAFISATDHTATPEQLARLDDVHDDGNPNSGAIWFSGNKVFYIIEPINGGPF